MTLTERERRIVLEVLASGNPAKRTSWELRVAGKAERFDSCSWGRTGEGPGVVLDAKLKGPATRFRKRDPVELDLRMGGVRIRRYTGEVLKAQGKTRASLAAVTGGFYADKVTLRGAARAYARMQPDEVLFDVLGLLPYDGSELDVEPMSAPLFTRDADEAYRGIDKVADVVGGVSAEADTLHADTAHNGHRARKRRSPATATFEAAAATFVVGRDVELEAFAPEPTEEDYSAVVVYRDADGVVAELERLELPDSPAPDGVDYLRELKDGENSWEVAHEAATRFVAREHKLDGLELRYVHPFLEDGDLVVFVEPAEVGGRPVVRRWLARIDRQTARLPSQRHVFEETTLVVASEEFVPVPPVASLGPPRAFGPLIGRDHADRPYASTGLGWIGVREDGRVVLNVDAARRAGVNVVESPTGTRVPY